MARGPLSLPFSPVPTTNQTNHTNRSKKLAHLLVLSKKQTVSVGTFPDTKYVLSNTRIRVIRLIRGEISGLADQSCSRRDRPDGEQRISSVGESRGIDFSTSLPGVSGPRPCERCCPPPSSVPSCRPSLRWRRPSSQYSWRGDSCVRAAALR